MTAPREASVNLHYGGSEFVPDIDLSVSVIHSPTYCALYVGCVCFFLSLDQLAKFQADVAALYSPVVRHDMR
jgi:hypothetical protein